MERKQILPPTYFLVSILFMGALRLVLPIRKMVVSPYNYFGILPVLIGAVVNMWCSSFYNKVKTTVKPFEPSSYLVTEGMHRFSRHPMYLGMVLILVGLAVLLGTIGPVLVIPAFIWVMTKKFIGIEEKALEETFGDAYLEYKKRVRRWI